jgi:hypothetical protein
MVPPVRFQRLRCANGSDAHEFSTTLCEYIENVLDISQFDEGSVPHLPAALVGIKDRRNPVPGLSINHRNRCSALTPRWCPRWFAVETAGCTLIPELRFTLAVMAKVRDNQDNS